MNKIVYIGVCIIFAVIIGAGFLALRSEKETAKCGIENCHGLDITCGSNIPDVCTEIYELGDSCRKYIECKIIDNKCQLVKNEKFDECKECVGECSQMFIENNIGLFGCESRCIGMNYKSENDDLVITPPDKDIEFPKLESNLENLIKSGNPQEFAEQHSIDYQDGKIKVVITLKDENSHIVDRFNVIIESQYKDIIQALVPITKLGELSNEPYVNFIRLPYKLEPLTP